VRINDRWWWWLEWGGTRVGEGRGFITY